MFTDTLLPALIAYVVGLLIAWFIWARSDSSNA